MGWGDGPEDPSGNDKESGSLDKRLAKQSNIKKFANSKELEEFLKNGPGDKRFNDFSQRAAPSMSFESPTGLSGSDMGLNYGAPVKETSDSPDYSETNIQVEGVDEADIIKTDGKYIYAVAQNNLFIVESYPAQEAEVVSKIEFKSKPSNLYINEDKLVVFGRDRNIRNTEVYKKFKRNSSYTFFKVFDISDKKNPDQIRDLDFEGDYFDSRMIGDHVYFLTRTGNYYYIEDEPLLPRVLENKEVISDTGKEISTDVYYFDMPYSRHNFTMVNAINIKDSNKEVKSEYYIMPRNQNIYVSQNNLYITYTKRLDQNEIEAEVGLEIVDEMAAPYLTPEEKEKIENIKSAESYILTKEEKMEKITQVLEGFERRLSDEEMDELEDGFEEKMQERMKEVIDKLETTVVHKIALKDGKLEYIAKGEVRGNVLNQFSMSEKDGYFRIATTRNRVWSHYLDNSERESYSNIFVLDENLKQVGSVTELAKTERIYSARFMQDRAYLVTFRQVDPLFTIDLSDPENPEVLGKLKIPGYSEYLHPYDDDTLIGLGRDAGTNNWGGTSIKGLKLSLFDVSDVENPKEKDVYILGESGSHSEALNNHKAFLFSKDKNLLAIPVRLRGRTLFQEGDATSSQDRKKIESEELEDQENVTTLPDVGRPVSDSFQGMVVFNVDKQGFDLKGKINHAPEENSHENKIKRGLYIEDTFYTFSDNYLKMNELEDLSEINLLPLQKEGSDDFEVIN